MDKANQLVVDKFNTERNHRKWGVSHWGGFKAAKLQPLAICRFRPNEGGTVRTNLSVNLAPVSGYMRSKAYAHVQQIYVPYQAIEKLRWGDDADFGVTEMTKRRLLAGEGLTLEAEGPISKAAKIVPKSVGGELLVQQTARLAYIAAVNHLRRHAYYAASQALRTANVVLPAILTANVLQRFNGVLEPERLVDGAINLTDDLPVKGIGFRNRDPLWNDSGRVFEAGGADTNSYDSFKYFNADRDWDGIVIEADADGHPNVYADLSRTAEISLRDMMKSKRLDALIRAFAGMVKDDPVHGEEKVARALYGMTCDFGDDCQVLYDQVFELSPEHRRPTDGPSINDVSGHFSFQTSLATLVPRSETGGQLVTLVSVKPLETLTSQPDPAQTEPWTLVNRVHDELQLDEVLLTRSDLESDLDPSEEDQPAFWVGHNSLLFDYQHHGVNETEVAETEMKSTMWTYDIPTSVTPDNVSYPDEGVEMYPFHNWNGPHVEYTCAQSAFIATDLARGPNPVERLQLFADDPSLISEEI